MVAAAMAIAPAWGTYPKVRITREGVIEAARAVRNRYAQLCQSTIIGKAEVPQRIIWSKFARAVTPYFPTGAGQVERLIFECALREISTTLLKRILAPEVLKVVQAPVLRMVEQKVRTPSQAPRMHKPLPRYTIPARIAQARQYSAALETLHQSPAIAPRIRFAWRRQQVLFGKVLRLAYLAARTPHLFAPRTAIWQRACP